MKIETTTKGVGELAGAEALRPSGNARFSRRTSWIALGVVVLLAAAVGIVVATRSSGDPTTLAAIRPVGIPANVSTQVASLMELSPVRARGSTAPEFSLTDQHGKHLSLSNFHGHPVVLTFLDPKCVTTCPIIAQEFVDAARQLGDGGAGAVFLAINVNRHALSAKTTEAFTKEHELGTIENWHFLSGTLATLRHIWVEYDVQVHTRIVHGKWTVVHTTIDYFIGPNGKERFVAGPHSDFGTTPTHRAYLPSGTYAAWGQGIPRIMRDM